MTPPETLRIGPYDWTVQCRDDHTAEMREADAETNSSMDPGRLTITVAHDLPPLVEIRHLLARCFDAMAHSGRLHDAYRDIGAGDERHYTTALAILAGRWVGLLRDNADALDYMAGETEAVPAVIVTGALLWRVRLDHEAIVDLDDADSTSGAWGRTRPRRLDVLIDPLRHPAAIAETFVHELWHVLGDAGHGVKDEEPLARLLGGETLSLFRRNGELVTYLRHRLYGNT